MLYPTKWGHIAICEECSVFLAWMMRLSRLCVKSRAALQCCHNIIQYAMMRHNLYCYFCIDPLSCTSIVSKCPCIEHLSFSCVFGLHCKQAELLWSSHMHLYKWLDKFPRLWPRWALHSDISSYSLKLIVWLSFFTCMKP